MIFIRFLKKDFINVRYALEQLVKRKIPFGIVLIYYVVVGSLAIICLPFIVLYVRIRLGIGFKALFSFMKQNIQGEA